MRICLSMICRQESSVIARSLTGARPHLSAFAVVDTGSTDDTAAIIQRALDGLPGALSWQPWIDDYAHSRNQALSLARLQDADWALMLDAKDEFVVPEGFEFPDPGPEIDGYRILVKYPGGSCEFRRPALIRLSSPWEWKRVRHEYLECPGGNTPILDGPYIQVHPGEGFRGRDPFMFAKDAAAIRTALLQDPGDSRYQFYLGQSLKDAGMLDAAVYAYEDRIENKSGWNEERYYSALMVARIKVSMRRDRGEIEADFKRAHAINPARAEAYGSLAEYLRMVALDYQSAYAYASTVMDLPAPSDVLFLERHWHEWRAKDEAAVSAYWCGKYEDSARLFVDLLHMDGYQEHESRWYAGYRFANGKISGTC